MQNGKINREKDKKINKRFVKYKEQQIKKTNTKEIRKNTKKNKEKPLCSRLNKKIFHEPKGFIYIQSVKSRC